MKGRRTRRTSKRDSGAEGPPDLRTCKAYKGFKGLRTTDPLVQGPNGNSRTTNHWPQGIQGFKDRRTEGPTGPQGVQGIQGPKDRRSHWTSGCCGIQGPKHSLEPLDLGCKESKGRKDHRTYRDCDCPPTYWTDRTYWANRPACNFLVYATNAGP